MSEVLASAWNFDDVPERWHEFLRGALEEWKCQSFLVRRRLGGKSGATVLLVDIRTQRHDGQAILKLSDDEPLDEERRRQEQARAGSPALARRIPAIAHASTHGRQSALLMTVAGHGLLETNMLAFVSGAGQLRLAYQKVSGSLLEEWNANPKPRLQTTLMSADGLLLDWLKHRLIPGERLQHVLTDLLHVPPGSDTFRFRGSDFPNPFGFSRPAFPGSGIKLLPAYGRMHGDFHAENILVREPSAAEFHFIDFAFYSDEAPLFF